MKKSISLLLCFAIVFSCAFSAYSINYADGVTDEMCNADYWSGKTYIAKDKVLMNSDEIAGLNSAIVAGKGTWVFDLEKDFGIYNALKQRDKCADIDIPEDNWFVGDVEIDNEEYYGKMIDAIKNTGFSETEREPMYAVTTRRAELNSLPTNDSLGYYAGDTDNEVLSSGLCVNEPFLIMQKCDIDDETFYWGYSINCSGWICADNLALFRTKAEWTDAWKVGIDAKDFIVVTQDKITLEPNADKNTSELKLTLGTILKLVPDDEIPKEIDERGTWNNYVVYIPTRDKNGYYVKQPALISQHCSVSTGFLPLTQENLLKVAFSCLGNRYGWAGVYDSYDCSLFNRVVYRCFGFEIPRNTTWQCKTPGIKSISSMTDNEKQEYVETLPAGSLLYFSGHTMIYLGTINGISYVISSFGSACEYEGDELVLNKIYSVAITPLTIMRKTGKTWLSQLTNVIVPSNGFDISDAEIRNGKVVYGEKELYESINYSIVTADNHTVINGEGIFSGSKAVNAVEVKSNDIRIRKGKTATADIIISNPDGLEYSVAYSTVSDKISIDGNGNIVALKRGSAGISIAVTDAFGNVSKEEITVEVTTFFDELILWFRNLFSA